MTDIPIGTVVEDAAGVIGVYAGPYVYGFVSATQPQHLFSPISPPKPVRSKKVQTAKLKEYGEYIRTAGAIQGHKPYIGQDPEVFVTDASGAVIPAWKFLPSKKEAVEMQETSTQTDNRLTTKSYWDGFQAEFSVGGCNSSVNSCIGWQMDTLYRGLSSIASFARSKYPGAHLSPANVLPVAPEDLTSAEDAYVEFGCMPSKNAYGLRGEHIHDPRSLGIRFAGYHMHFNLGVLGKADPVRVVKFLDATLGVAAVSLAEGRESALRRKFYGLPGEYRTRVYGLEYRVLGQVVLWHPATANLLWELARTAVGCVERGIDFIWSASEQEVIEVLLNEDVAGARAILARNETVFKKMLAQHRAVTHSWTIQAHATCMNGISHAVADPMNVEKNWEIGTGRWMWHCGGRGKNWAKASSLLEQGVKV